MIEMAKEQGELVVGVNDLSSKKRPWGADARVAGQDCGFRLACNTR